MNATIGLWLASQMFFIDASSIKLGFRPDRVLFFVILAMFVVKLFRHEATARPLNAVDYLMIIFTLFTSASLIHSGVNSDPAYGKNKWLNALFNITYFPFSIFYVSSSLRCSLHDAKKILTALAIIGTYLTFTGLFEHYGVEALIWPKTILDGSLGVHFGRVRGPFLDSVTMGRILSVCFVSTLLLSTLCRGARKTICLITCILTPVSIYFTYTRGPWIGFAFALLVLLLLRNSMKRFVTVLLAVFFVVGFAGVGSKMSFLEGTLFSQRQETVNDRRVSYAIAYRMGTDNPLFGVGFGGFEGQFDNYYVEPAGIVASPEKMSHNTYLGLFSETGAVGILLYVTILMGLMKKSYHRYREASDGDQFQGDLAVAVLAVGSMYLVSGLVSDLRWNLMQNNVMYLFFGLLMGYETRSPTMTPLDGKSLE